LISPLLNEKRKRMATSTHRIINVPHSLIHPASYNFFHLVLLSISFWDYVVWISLIAFAGIPPTMVLSGTSLLTTAPAATTEFSPTVTPGNMVAPAPIQAFLLICTGPGTSDCRLVGDSGCPSESKLTFGAISTSSSMVIPPKSKKTQSKLMNTFLPILVCLP